MLATVAAYIDLNAVRAGIVKIRVSGVGAGAEALKGQGLHAMVCMKCWAEPMRFVEMARRGRRCIDGIGNC
ncbi:MAG: hypothetical protein R3F19_11685 [Verrucomicrobiales bacterium]